MKFYQSTLATSILTVLVGFGSTAPGAVYQWTDWQANPSMGIYTGQIVTATTTVDVTYTNLNGIAFFQNGVDGNTTDYFAQGPSGSLGRNPATSPYTSDTVENIPPAAEMVALRFAGSQTLEFSDTIANPVFSYVSLNSNGYAFDQDFEILSVGSVDGNDQGYWGTGTSSKNVVDLGGGVFEYQLIGTGEPHGTVRFLGAFDTVSWRSLSSENWNGFTVGIEGTEDEVFPPDPPVTVVPDGGQTLPLFCLSLAGLIALRKRYSR